jgi:histidine triad (HIT) family protein
MNDCIFCKIIKGEIPTKKFYEDKHCIIIEDINKIAKKHYLLIPKNHYALLEEAKLKDQISLGKSLKKLTTLKQELGLENGYRLIVNQGKDAGQTVHHLHLHILGGELLRWE